MREDAQTFITARLRSLRQEWEDALGEDWPQGMEREVLLLVDVSAALGLGDRRLADVLGAPAWELAAGVCSQTVRLVPQTVEVLR